MLKLVVTFFFFKFRKSSQAAYLNQLGLQGESLMERHLLEALSESWEVHKHCRHLMKKQENKP